MSNIFIEKSSRRIDEANEARRIVPNLLLLFKKAFHEVKVSDQRLSFNIFWESSTWTYTKIKLYENSDW